MVCHYAGMVVTEGERRVVAVLMADVAGSTAIGEQLGPERSKYLFDEVVRLMSEQVERYDGTVAQLLGDGLLAVFGAPVAHEDDSERAVRAGIAIQRALAAYSREVDDAYGIELRARVAVNTGPVLITPDGDGPDRWNALGDTVNVTARLQALAERGRGDARPRHRRPGAGLLRARRSWGRPSCAAAAGRSSSSGWWVSAIGTPGRPTAPWSAATPSSPSCVAPSSGRRTASA